MKYLVVLLFCAGCASQPANTNTKANDIYINSTQDFSACKYLGIVQTEDVENWQVELRKQAGTKGASHIQSSGPNEVGFNEIVRGNAYLCKTM